MPFVLLPTISFFSGTCRLLVFGALGRIPISICVFGFAVHMLGAAFLATIDGKHKWLALLVILLDILTLVIGLIMLTSRRDSSVGQSPDLFFLVIDVSGLTLFLMAQVIIAMVLRRWFRMQACRIAARSCEAAMVLFFVVSMVHWIRNLTVSSARISEILENLILACVVMGCVVMCLGLCPALIRRFVKPNEIRP
jgi:hypothetical protein